MNPNRSLMLRAAAVCAMSAYLLLSSPPPVLARSSCWGICVENECPINLEPYCTGCPGPYTCAPNQFWCGPFDMYQIDCGPES
jgi:hypothetical protein